jgi:hypothetical protein
MNKTAYQRRLETILKARLEAQMLMDPEFAAWVAKIREWRNVEQAPQAPADQPGDQ